MPTVQTMGLVVEGCIVALPPTAVDFVAISSHKLGGEVKTFIAEIYTKSISEIGGRVAYHRAVFTIDYTIAIYIFKFEIPRFYGSDIVSRRSIDIFISLIHAFHLITIEMPNRVTCQSTRHRVVFVERIFISPTE